MSETNDTEANLTETAISGASLLDAVKEENDGDFHDLPGGEDDDNIDSMIPNLPMRKRKASQADQEEDSDQSNDAKRGRISSTLKKEEEEDDDDDDTEEDVEKSSSSPAPEGAANGVSTAARGKLKPIKRPPMSKAREIRLEQNRKAARESRRRKKVMIEELQRSVIFFSRANGTLKQQNDELHRLLISAQAQVQALEASQRANAAANPSAVAPGAATSIKGEAQGTVDSASADGGTKDTAVTDPNVATFANNAVSQQQQQPLSLQGITQAQQAAAAQAAATQAMYEANGFPPAAARAAAQTFSQAAVAAAAAAGGTPAPAAPASANAPADGSSNNPAPAGAWTPGHGGVQQAMAFQQAYLQAMAMGAQGGASAPNVPQTQGPQGAAATPAAAGAPGQGPYADALNQFAMQQAQFAALAGMPGSAVPSAQGTAAAGTAANPAIFQHPQQQAAALQFANAANQMQAAAVWQGAAAAAMGAPAGTVGSVGGSSAAPMPSPATTTVQQGDGS